MSSAPPLKIRLLSLAALFGVVVLLWIPQGLRQTGLIFEGWRVLHQYSDAPLSSIGSSLFPTRPLTYLPVLSGYLLTPETTIGFNFMIATAILLRGVLAYGLMLQLLPKQGFIALSVALLFMLYPSDRGLFIPRSLVPHYGVIFGLLAIYLLLRYWRRPSPWYALAIPAAQLFSLGIHDLMYPLFFAAPFALWLMADSPKPVLTRRWFALSAGWLALPSFLLLRVLWLLQSDQAGYLTQISSLNTQPVVDEQGYGFIWREGLRHVFERQILAWPDILQNIQPTTLDWVLVSAGLLLILGLIWSGRNITQGTISARKSALLSLGALVIIVLGFIPFIPGGYWGVDWRVFFASALGAALVIALFLDMLRRFAPFAAYGLLFVLLAAVLLDGFGQQRTYVQGSAKVQRLIGDVMLQTGGINPQTHLIVVDSAQIYSNDPIYMQQADITLGGGLNYFYKDVLPPDFDYEDQIGYCHIGTEIYYACQFRAEGLIYRHYVIEGVEYIFKTDVLAYEDLLIFNTRRDGSIHLLETIPPEFFAFDPAETDPTAPIFSAYQPANLIDPTAPPPSRALTFFPCWPVSDCLPLVTPYEDTPQRAINYEFDRIPSGTGWAQYYTGLENLWTTLPTATYYARLIPDTDYRLSFRVLFYLLPETIANLAVSANGQALDLSLEAQADGTLIYHADISADLLGEDGALDLRFYAAPLVSPQALGMGADERELGLLFDWLRLEASGE